jgi:hypothetical protein
MILIKFDDWDDVAEAIGFPDYRNLDELKERAKEIYGKVVEIMDDTQRIKDVI